MINATNTEQLASIWASGCEYVVSYNEDVLENPFQVTVEGGPVGAGGLVGRYATYALALITVTSKVAQDEADNA